MIPRWQAPAFWFTRPGLRTALLSPLSALVGSIAVSRLRRAGERVSVPVICCGNLTAGGTGKTPLTLDLLRRLHRRGHQPHALLRGYGGRLRGPLQVRPQEHTAADTGDEALLLAAVAPAWIGADRAASARAAIAAGATCLVMDDGLQNPSLEKDLSLIVVDGATGFGNGRVLPAGPLRLPLSVGLKQGDAMIIMGEGDAVEHGTMPVLKAGLSNEEHAELLKGQTVIAFAGIGRPEKFFTSLRQAGIIPLECIAFPDHHVWTRQDLDRLTARAARSGARLLTTEKDAVRLPPEFRKNITAIPVTLRWQDERQIEMLLDRYCPLRTDTPP
ncbi:tetraacyldisaccharide 4'-kinase [Acetobacter sp. AN02]|uniref:tetraacyldisaccharide 4'-kinase n=1 Tax=Acetobacter sp. AN02 TaxID=2894186 RepID=UPI0024342959|nr:tetraacyldisaccharide 4'-kinase [Acetobacter sp. AN02]MDG6095232.1 tetraacyldisaccharide 4'-kinase [Acetobacter sp. AN02]